MAPLPRVLDYSDQPNWAEQAAQIAAEDRFFVPTISAFEEARIVPGAAQYRTGKPGLHAAGVYLADGTFIRASGRFKQLDVKWTTGGLDATHLDPKDFRPVRRLGSGLFLGTIPAHFGHMLIEGLARIWAATEHPDLPLYFTERSGSTGPVESPHSMFSRFSALDFDFSRLRLITETTEFDQLWVPEAGMIIRHSASRKYVESMRGLSPVAAQTPSTDQPVYLSRAGIRPGGFKRRLLGETVFERALEKSGIKVLRLENLPFEAGLRELARHRIIIGPLGSALHNSLFLSERNLFYISNAINVDKLRTYFTIDRAAGHSSCALRYRDAMNDGRSALWSEYVDSNDEGNALIDFNTVLRSFQDLGLIERRYEVNMNDPEIAAEVQIYLSNVRSQILPGTPPYVRAEIESELTQELPEFVFPGR